MLYVESYVVVWLRRRDSSTPCQFKSFVMESGVSSEEQYEEKASNYLQRRVIFTISNTFGLMHVRSDGNRDRALKAPSKWVTDWRLSDRVESFGKYGGPTLNCLVQKQDLKNLWKDPNWMNIPGTRPKDLRRMDHLIGDSETNFTTPKIEPLKNPSQPGKPDLQKYVWIFPFKFARVKRSLNIEYICIIFNQNLCGALFWTPPRRRYTASKKPHMREYVLP